MRAVPRRQVPARRPGQTRLRRFSCTMTYHACLGLVKTRLLDDRRRHRPARLTERSCASELPVESQNREDPLLLVDVRSVDGAVPDVTADVATVRQVLHAREHVD